ncbi:hypothetical protein GUITHDRAFT_104442 [Guillardia theta CCMP2712]|uniref:AB hydrolase-1 domain-containing protein n=3 Tax=Guillardia theta TaxID=55529 RepID=L1JPB6_GUITC|nr:hypothetical protein GUITHDRAFT_104442 [Guillardia theta CCMP2712]EKX50045.1 hypothetical protein GUITHDRAFT_104442 [Guillardia theta CCMP2712]|eukprot:XP_005837025.1 hypothetical protein GUITHDRAFT_104442 [Guillardia theta CCMP2712]
MLRLAAGNVLVLSQARSSDALCGTKPRSWEFWMPWSEETVTVATEGSVSSNKREVFYRVVGDESKERSKVKGKEGKRKPLLVIADKFKDHEYLTVMEAVCTSDRRVILYDALGTGLSEPLPAETRQALSSNPANAESFAVEELTRLWADISKTLKVDQVHVLGNGFGAKVAASFAKQEKTAKSVASLIFASMEAGTTAPPGVKVLETKDPSNLCSPATEEKEKEDFVQGLISFMDEVDLS